MTDKEKAIVMAHTGICMLTGDKFQTFHKYVEDIMGRPIMTHEIGLLADTIKEKTKADFIALCADESSSENPNKWIPVSERLPEFRKEVLTCTDGGFIEIQSLEDSYDGYWENQNGDWTDLEEITAWMPLPEPYKESEE